MPSTVISLRQGQLADATPGLLDYLAFALEEGVSARMYLRVGEVEIGRVDVGQGRILHAELPGSQGDPVLPLLGKLPPVDVVLAAYRGGPTTVTPEAFERWWAAPASLAKLRAPLAQAFAHLDASPTPSAGPTAPSKPAPRAEGAGTPATGVETDTFDDLFARAMETYLQRHHAAALELFERCARLRPHDRRVAHNMERLRARLRKDP